MLQEPHKVTVETKYGEDYHSRPALSPWPHSTSQTFFPDTAAREREDAAFYASMRFMQQEERIDDSDDESDETTATAAPKKKRAMKRPIVEYILVDASIMRVMLLRY